MPRNNQLRILIMYAHPTKQHYLTIDSADACIQTKMMITLLYQAFRENNISVIWRELFALESLDQHKCNFVKTKRLQRAMQLPDKYHRNNFTATNSSRITTYSIPESLCATIQRQINFDFNKQMQYRAHMTGWTVTDLIPM